MVSSIVLLLTLIGHNNVLMWYIFHYVIMWIKTPKKKSFRNTVKTHSGGKMFLAQIKDIFSKANYCKWQPTLHFTVLYNPKFTICPSYCFFQLMNYPPPKQMVKVICNLQYLTKSYSSKKLKFKQCTIEYHTNLAPIYFVWDLGR